MSRTYYVVEFEIDKIKQATLITCYQVFGAHPLMD